MPDSNSWQYSDRTSAEDGEPSSTKSGDPDSTSTGDPDSTSTGDSDGDPDSTRPTIAVRATEPRDFAAIERISGLVYPSSPWSSRDLERQRRHFPEGQLVAVDAATGEVVGMAASLRIDSKHYSDGTSYARVTAYGSFRNHDPHGDTLYGAEVMVDPARRRQGIGASLYEGRRQLARRLGVRRILAGARLPGYSAYADMLTANEYVRHVVAGSLRDPTLSFQLQQGFRVVGIVERYANDDPQSQGYAALIEWPCDRHLPTLESARPRIAPPRAPSRTAPHRLRQVAPQRRARAS
jgi:GNAT superfamily N-acetyltransferase